MVNNFEQIRGLLEFRSDDDFYVVQVIKRRKDHKDGENLYNVMTLNELLRIEDGKANRKSH